MKQISVTTLSRLITLLYNNHIIITTFKTEKQLFRNYPKTNYFKLKDIFNEYWDDFLTFAYEKNS